MVSVAMEELAETTSVKEMNMKTSMHVDQPLVNRIQDANAVSKTFVNH